MTLTQQNAARRGANPLQQSGRGKRSKLVVLSLIAVVTAFPFYAMVIMSLKPGQAMEFPQSLIPTGLSTEAYQNILGNDDLLQWLVNTLIYSLVSVVVVLLVSAMAGYAFAKKRFPGRELLFWLFIMMVMVPYHVTVLPLFVGMAQVGGVNTYWGLIMPSLANAQAVFLMRQFIQGIPDEFFEAAKVDGASELRIFLTMVLPLSRPILATLGVFVFLWHWNDFLWPLIITRSSEMWTLTVGIASLNQQQVPLATVLAGSVFALVPIFVAYLIAQRQVQEGMMGSGVKG
jgi:multiple sugar transport system permease protein